jgi:sarcosine oxidase gamma subunit
MKEQEKTMKKVMGPVLKNISRALPLFVAMVCWASPASAANLFAKVSQTGVLISGSEVTGVTKLGPGQYEVTFTSDVSPCAYVATTANAYSQALQVFTAGGHLGPNGVYVETKNQGGGLTDGPFNLVVVCGIPQMKYAVVGYSGELVRGTVGATLTVLGAGRYNVTFLESVSTCAYIASVGDPGNGLVYYPAGVYTGSSSLNSRTVYIETKNPGGGLQSGIPFHLAAICSSAPQTRIAVVRDTGLIQRGSALTSAFRSAPGQYAVVSNANINPSCATVATRGSVDRAVPFSPATVEIVNGPAANTVGVQVRQLLFFGGALANQAFHAAIVCR